MSSPSIPPRAIPKDLYNEFTLNGKVAVQYAYYNNTVTTGTYIAAETYKSTFLQLEKKIFEYYGREINAFYDAFNDYNIEDKTVLVWGLAGCNCEAMALWQGASEVYVVDYNKPICEHNRVSVLTHSELDNLSFKFDYAISFSSFEHDGLGRYGDPLAPHGDIKAMQLAKKMLKDDGVLFLGVPLGRDALIWNAHRIYGKERLPMLLKGWLPLDVYTVYCGRDIFSEQVGSFSQPLLALKKQPRVNVSKEELLVSLHHAKELSKLPHPGTRDGRMLMQLIEIIIAAAE